VIHLRETCCCSTNLCTWRPNTVYKNRRVRRHQATTGNLKTCDHLCCMEVHQAGDARLSAAALRRAPSAAGHGPPQAVAACLCRSPPSAGRRCMSLQVAARPSADVDCLRGRIATGEPPNCGTRLLSKFFTVLFVKDGDLPIIVFYYSPLCK
jgi:hypothetical protein